MIYDSRKPMGLGKNGTVRRRHTEIFAMLRWRGAARSLVKRPGNAADK